MINVQILSIQNKYFINLINLQSTNKFINCCDFNKLCQHFNLKRLKKMCQLF